MATELTELTNLLKSQNQNNNSNFKNLERVIEQVFSQIRSSLEGIRNTENQQVSIMQDSLNKELLEEQLIEKDIQQGDREIISSLKEINHILQEQFDFSRDSENKKRLSEHVQKDYQIEQKEQIDFSGIESLIKELIKTTEEAGSSSTSEIESIAQGLGITSLLGVLKDIAFKLGGFILKNPLLAAGAAGIGMGASGGSGSLTGSVLTGAVTGAARGGIPGAVAGGAVGAVGWGAGRVFSRGKDSDPRIGRWDDVEYGTSKKKFEFKPEIASVLKETAEKTGVDENYLRTMAHIESKGNPKAFNQGSKAAGLFQFIPSTAKMYGLKGNEFDPRASSEAAAKLTLDNKKALEKAGIEATPEMLYIAHQQGSKGAADLVKYAKEGRSFSQLPKQLQTNIQSNVPGRKSLGAEEFLDFWKTSYKQHAAVAGLETRNQVKTTGNNKLDSKPQNMVDVSDLRVKGGLKGQAFKGGETEEGLMNLARTIQAQEKDLPGGLNRFSSFNDAYHLKANPKSKHTQGLALDFSLKDSKYSGEASNYVKEQLMNSGLSEKDFKIINEYKNPSKHATGGHIHVNFANKEAAERYAAITKGEKVSPTEEKKTYAKADEKELPEGKGYSEEESEMEEIDEPILREESQERSKESSLVKAKESQLNNFGVTPINQQNPLGGIIQPTGGGIFGGVGQQNPFAALQGILGGIGSAVSMGQNMGNMGSMGGIYGAQGAIGGMQGVLGSLGMQSPALGQVGQAMGSIGNVMSSVQTAKNMGSMGGGGILGGINAASGAIGAAGNIFNAVQGLGSIFGGESSQKTGNMIKDNPALKGMADTVGDFFGIKSVGKDRTDDLSDPSKWHPIESKGIGDDAAAVKSKYDSASLMPSVSTDGFSLEGTTKSVETGKEEMMMPSSGEGQSPVVINSAGGGGAGGGGGNSQSNPSSAGVMGIDVGVRNEEATLLRAQYGSVRIV